MTSSASVLVFKTIIWILSGLRNLDFFLVLLEILPDFRVGRLHFRKQFRLVREDQMDFLEFTDLGKVSRVPIQVRGLGLVHGDAQIDEFVQDIAPDGFRAAIFEIRQRRF